MDPKKTLEDLRTLVEDIFYTLDDKEKADLSMEMIDKFQDLDTWMSKGGFSPWEKENQ